MTNFNNVLSDIVQFKGDVQMFASASEKDRLRPGRLQTINQSIAWFRNTTLEEINDKLSENDRDKFPSSLYNAFAAVENKIHQLTRLHEGKVLKRILSGYFELLKILESELLSVTSTEEIDIKSAKISPIKIPEQELGIRFGINLETGQVGIDRQPGRGDIEATQAIQPALLRAVESAKIILKKNNAYCYDFLVSILDDYQEEIAIEASEIDFGIVFSLATELRNGLNEARRLEVLVENPALAPMAAIKVQTVIDMNSTLMAGTELGNLLVAKTELYDETPQQMQEARAAGDAFRLEVEASKGVFTDEAKRVIILSQKAVTGKGEIKGRLFERLVSKNTTVAVGYSAAIVAGAISGLPIIVGASVFAGIVLSETITRAGKSSWDDLKPDVQSGLKRVHDFAIEKRETFKRTSNLADDGDWFGRLMDRVIRSKRKLSIQSDKAVFPHPRLIVAASEFNQLMHMMRGVSDELKDLNLPTESVLGGSLVDAVRDLQPNDILFLSLGDLISAGSSTQVTLVNHMNKFMSDKHIIVESVLSSNIKYDKKFWASLGLKHTPIIRLQGSISESIHLRAALSNHIKRNIGFIKWTLDPDHHRIPIEFRK